MTVADGIIKCMTEPERDNRRPHDPRRSITMDDQMWGQVTALAKHQRTNASQIVRDAVELFLRDHDYFTGRVERARMEAHYNDRKDDQ